MRPQPKLLPVMKGEPSSGGGPSKAEDGGWVENIMLGTDIHYFF